VAEGDSCAGSCDGRVLLLSMIGQFRDAVTTHFEASKHITPGISVRGYSDFQEEGRRLSSQSILLQRELPNIFDLTKGAVSQLYPSMMRDYTAVSLYCLATAWNARPDLDNYGSPDNEYISMVKEGRRVSRPDWKSQFDACIPDLQARFPNIRMTRNDDINLHLSVFRDACEELIGQFAIADQEEARRREAEMNRPVENIMGDKIEVHGSGNTIVNRATVIHAFNRVKATQGEEVAKLLLEVEAAINNSGNEEAAENFESFSEELNKPEPKKSLLKTLWQGTLAALPTLKELPGVVTSISALFA